MTAVSPYHRRRCRIFGSPSLTPLADDLTEPTRALPIPRATTVLLVSRPVNPR